MRTLYRSTVCFVLMVWMGVAASAAITLPSVLSDHMVVQEGMKVPVWGKASAGEAITVTMGDRKACGKADKDGKWMVKLGRLKAGGPFEMTVKGKDETVTVHDVLVGEVWIASGQSNMQWSVKNSNNGDQEIAEAKYPNIRLFTVPNVTAAEPQEDCKGSWVACSPETVPGFSAVAYFFGRELHKQLGASVGLINTSWGGTPAESWTSKCTLEANPTFKPILERWDKIVAEYPKAKAEFDKQMAEWQKAADKAKAENQPEPPKPNAPLGPDHPHRASSLYNAMIAPLVPFAFRGAIWYQGESNAGRAYQYRELMPAMIEDWRRHWGEGAFPFLMVQLANFMDRKPEPADSAWAELREAQLMTLKLKNTGMATIIDIGDAKDIHPKDKQNVGKRLAVWALDKTYGKCTPYSGPLYKSKWAHGDHVTLRFKAVDGGLIAKGGDPLKGFAVAGAGADKKFVWADAKIKGRKVIVSSPQVAKPVAVRYGWADNPECTLFNKADLPASPFRTDKWPGVTVNEK